MNKYWSPQEVLNAGKRKNPSKRLLSYLEAFRRDELTTGAPKRPDGYAAQRDVMVKVMRSLYPAQGLHQTINGSDVVAPNFWEVLLTLHHLTHDIELTDNMGYYREKIGAGIFTAKEQPYAEFTIIGSELVKSLEPRHSNNIKHYKATLSLDRRNRKLTLRTGTHRQVIRQYKNERSANYLALLKLYTNAGEPQTRTDLTSLSAKTVLKDIPKNIGFEGILREQFIQNGYIDKQSTLTLHKTVELGKEDYERLCAEVVKD